MEIQIGIKRKLLIIGSVLFLVFIALLVTIFGFVLFWSPEAQANKDFENKFDLVLIGRVKEVSFNEYGQKLVCLDVIESNYNEYFPVFNPNNQELDQSEIWEHRFFIKVKDKKAIFIFKNDRKKRKVTDYIKKDNIIKINTEGKKGYRVYNKDGSIYYGGYYISTSPIRDNIKNSCLNE